jgi:hypothetical protein
LAQTTVERGLESVLTREMIEGYPADSNTKEILHSLLPLLDEIPAVVQAGNRSFVVYGPPSSTSPLGYVHVHKNEERYRCTSKNCKVISGAGKQQKVSKLCVHQHVLFCTLNLRNLPVNFSSSSVSPQTLTFSTEDTNNLPTSKAASSTFDCTSSLSADQVNPSSLSADHPSIGRLSTIQANMDRSLPSIIPFEILKVAKQMDAATVLNAKEVISSL